jgi:hypothetical protein
MTSLVKTDPSGPTMAVGASQKRLEKTRKNINSNLLNTIHIVTKRLLFKGTVPRKGVRVFDLGWLF